MKEKKGNLERKEMVKRMILQKQVNRELNKKIYWKYVIILPSNTIKRLGWNEGDELNHNIKGNALCIKKKS